MKSITINFTPVWCTLLPQDLGEEWTTLEKDLNALLSFRPTGYFFSPQYQSGIWDGYTRLYHEKTRKFRAGLLSKVVQFLQSQGYQVQIDNAPQPREFIQKSFTYQLRPYQVRAAQDITKIRYGILQAPMRAGKTIIFVSVVDSERQFPAIFICRSLDLAYQTRERLQTFLPDISVGIVGDGKVDIQDVTIVTIQSAFSAYGKTCKELDKEKVAEDKAAVRRLLTEAKLVFYDEVHHVKSATSRFVLDRCPHTTLKIGLSATPFAGTPEDMRIEEVIGPVIHQISYSELIQEGFLLRPHIYMYKLPEMDIDDHYQTVYKKAVVENEFLTGLIKKLVDTLTGMKKSVVVQVEFINHAKRLGKALGVPVLTGSERDMSVRVDIKKKLESKEILCLVSTLFEEGLDVPCHPPEQYLITASGELVFAGEVKAGDMLRGSLGKPCKVEKVSTHKFKGEIIRITPLGTTYSIDVTPDHVIPVLQPSTYQFKRGIPRREYYNLAPKNFVLKRAKDIKLYDVIAFSKGVWGDQGQETIDLAFFLKENFPGLCWDESFVWLKTSNSGNSGEALTARQIAKDLKIPMSVVYNYKYGKLSNKAEKYRFLLDKYFQQNKDRISPVKKIPRFLSITPELFRLLGYYLAEGSSTKGTVTFAFSQLEEEFIGDTVSLLQKVFAQSSYVADSKASKSTVVVISSRILSCLFEKLCGKGAGRKQLSPVVLSANNECLKHLVMGYWRGDGFSQRRAYSFSSNSLVLLSQIRDILAGRFGIISSLRKYATLENVLTVGGEYFDAMGELLEEFLPDVNVKNTHSQAWQDSNYIYFPVVKVERKSYDGDVICLGVEGDHLYSTISGLVHNSLDYTINAAGGLSSIGTLQRMRSITMTEGKTSCGIIDFFHQCKYLKRHSKERWKSYTSEPEFVVEMRDVSNKTLEEI